jgi:hypothetical protein
MEGEPVTGTLMVILIVLVALQVWVQREPVRERVDSSRRSGAFERNMEMSEGKRCPLSCG